jgi:cyclophilin family peptidyl-prolyl cis-trans isomerase
MFSGGWADFRLGAIRLGASIAGAKTAGFAVFFEKDTTSTLGVAMGHCKVFACVVVGLASMFVIVPLAAGQAGQAGEGGDPQAAATAKANFDQRFAEYKDAARNIEQLQSDFQTADPATREQINDQLRDAVAAAKQKLDAMVVAATEAYRTAPNADPQITELLTAVAQFYSVGESPKSEGGVVNGGDNYERALPIIEVLVAGGAPEKRLPMWGFLAAFATNDYDLAQKYLDRAKESEALVHPQTLEDQVDQQAMASVLQYASLLEKYRELWAKEQEIRAAEAEADDLPRVKLATTKGDIVIELFENEAPQATANFLSLAKSGFYSNVAFHRVLPMFMAQGGDPQGDGSGGPGYSIRCECEEPDARHHFRGTLSMAHAGRDTGGSQFFLTFVPTTHLDGKHTVFGRVVEGIEVLGELQKRDPQAPGATPPDRILTAEVIRDRGHEYKFDKLPSRR